MSRIKISDFISQIGDGIHGTPIYTEQGEYYFINGNNLVDGKIVISSDTLMISKDEYNKIKKPLEENTILLSINGTLGKIAMYEGENVALGKSVCYINVKENVNKYFVKYVLTTKEFQKYIRLVAHGSTIKNLAPSQIANYEFNISEKLEQDKIAFLLKSIEDKIENNNKVNMALESMAKTIYDYWFLQFEFPNEDGKPYKSSGGKMVWNEKLKREIPAGWKQGTFFDLIEIGNGKDHKELHNGKVPVYGSGGVMRFVDKAIYDGESVLIPRKGTLNNIIYVNGAFWTVDTMFYSKMKMKHTAIFTYYSVRLYDFEKLNTGTGVPSMTSSIIYDLKTIIPTRQILKDFDLAVQSFYKQIQANRKENEELASLRDFLLPLLMNGQVSFKV